MGWWSCPAAEGELRKTDDVVFLVSDAFTFSGLLIAYAFLRWSAPAYNGDPEAFTFY